MSPMALKDLFIRPTRPQLDEEWGVSGSSSYTGIITDEYSSTLRGTEGVKVYEQMRRGDAQVYAALQAVKLPIRSADWRIDMAKQEDPQTAKEQKEFIEELLFETLSWDRQLQRILTMLDFGFKYLELVFTIDAKGRIAWKRWGDRLQKAHYRWLTSENKPGVEQQPTATDYDLETGRDLRNNTDPISIPAEKLLIFSFQQEGDDRNGISILRPAYKHWFYKENLYKIGAISAERYGVGIPDIEIPSEFNQKDLDKAAELGRNLKSNEKAYIARPASWKVNILTPAGDPKAAAIQKLIDHHDHKILMAVLAPFLDLGSKETGSFALSKDQSSFFVLGLESIAKYICEIVNDKIRQLILLNWPGTRYFPKLCFSGIGKIDFAEYSTALATIQNAGMTELTPEVKRYIHKTFDLPAPPEEDEEDKALDALDAELALLEGTLAGDTTPEPKEEAPVEEPEEEPKEEKKKMAEEEERTEDKTPADSFMMRIRALRAAIASFKLQNAKITDKSIKAQFNASIRQKIDLLRAQMASGDPTDGSGADAEIESRQRLAAKKEELNTRLERARQAVATAKDTQGRDKATARLKDIQEAIDRIDAQLRSPEPAASFDFQDAIQSTKAERIFQGAINEEERYIHARYKEWDDLATRTEQGLRDYLAAKIKSAKTEMVGGIEIISRTGNAALLAEIKRGVGQQFERMGNKMLGNKMAASIMKDSANAAARTWQDMKGARTNLARIEIDAGLLRSFTAGHVSNVRGVLFNEQRRVNEKLSDVLTQGVSVQLALDQASQIAFNRNILKLSVITHPRALFKSIIEGQAKAEGTVMFKLLVPKQVRNTLSVIGMTAALLFLVRTFHDWNKENGTKENVNVTGGMGLHHNSQEYYYPVDQASMPQETAISRSQRTEWLAELKTRAEELAKMAGNTAAAIAAVAAVNALLKTKDEKAAP